MSKKDAEQTVNKNVIGLDLGTGNIVAAKQIDNKVQINSIRNAFLSISPEHVKSSQMAETNLNYIELFDADGNTESLCVLNDDAFKFANIFGGELRRPMSRGVISKNDEDSVEIITQMIKSLIGTTANGKCVYSVPAAPVDDEEFAPISYHTKLFKKMITSFGYDAEPLNEGKAVIFSECASTNFTGLGISCGSGMTNFNLSFKGITIHEFSVAMGGDWIDQAVANASSAVVSRITNIKEQHLDLTKTLFKEYNKNERRILEALTFYYEDYLEQTIKYMVEQFKEVSGDLETDDPISIVISGGTSLPNGFLEKFKEIFDTHKFPYKISEIRRASDPLNSVAKGSLIYAYWLENKK